MGKDKVERERERLKKGERGSVQDWGILSASLKSASSSNLP